MLDCSQPPEQMCRAQSDAGAGGDGDADGSGATDGGIAPG
jgi:hypothetical protein